MLCCAIGRKLDGLTITRQFLPFLPGLMININQTRLHASFFLSLYFPFSVSLSLSVSHSVCHSICLIVFHTGKRDTMFIEGWIHLPARRQEMAIYRLLSPHWKSHKLPLSSLSSFHSNSILFPSVAGREIGVQNEKASKGQSWMSDKGTREVTIPMRK